MVFLKPNLVIEPLVERWYAWPHIISPVTASLNVTKKHLEIMNSYVESPEYHLNATKDPKMRGGPFIDYEENRAPEVVTLIDQTLEKQSDLLSLAFALQELNNMLCKKAKGYSLELLYSQVPEILKGYVELVYDLNNNPSFRVFEQLLYNSKYYKANCQSVALWLTNNDSRPFSLSTPRLGANNIMNFEIPFNSPLIDALSKMKRVSRSYEEIKEMFEIKGEEDELFQSFFIDTPPSPYKRNMKEIK